MPKGVGCVRLPFLFFSKYAYRFGLCVYLLEKEVLVVAFPLEKVKIIGKKPVELRFYGFFCYLEGYKRTEKRRKLEREEY